MSRAYYFGPHREPGHYLWARGWISTYGHIVERPTWRGKKTHLDGAFAPRIDRVNGVYVCNADESLNPEIRRSVECEQGVCLVHYFPDLNFSALAWWDRTQGDSRGACNSVYLLEGQHDFGDLARALGQDFPEVVENLRSAGFPLQHVTLGAKVPLAPPESATTRLAKVLKAAGAVVTIDAGASFYRPCTQCGRPSDLDKPHKLYDIGYYPNGHIINRPMCTDCSPVGEALEAAIRAEIGIMRKVTGAAILKLKALCDLAVTANNAPSLDALPPDFGERLSKACAEYQAMWQPGGGVT